MLPQLLLNGLISGAIYALTALGFVVVFRAVRFFNFAHGAIYAIGAYVGYLAIVTFKLGVIPGFLIAASFSCIAGMTTDRFVYRPLRKRKSPNLIFLIASFGIFIVFQNLIQLVFGAQLLTIRTGQVKEGHHFLSTVITDIQIAIVLITFLVTVGLWLFSERTKLGMEMRAVAEDQVGASVVGINPERTKLWAFAIGSSLAGFAGILISFETNIEPTMGFNAILKAIIASIIGGIGSIPGAALGGVLLGLAENIGIWKINAGWKDAIAFGVLVFFLLLRPQGILGRKSDRV